MSIELSWIGIVLEMLVSPCMSCSHLLEKVSVPTSIADSPRCVAIRFQPDWGRRIKLLISLSLTFAFHSLVVTWLRLAVQYVFRNCVRV